MEQVIVPKYPDNKKKHTVVRKKEKHSDNHKQQLISIQKYVCGLECNLVVSLLATIIISKSKLNDIIAQFP